jgi:hypothetical protein
MGNLPRASGAARLVWLLQSAEVVPKMFRAVASILAIGFALLANLGQVAATERDDAAAGFERVLAKSNTVTPPAYRAFRRLEGGVTDSERRGWIEAWTEFQPGRGFTFDIVREGGSDYIREKVLRGMLTTERDLLSRGRRLRASFEAKNYGFEDGGMVDGLQRILLKPAKKSDGIVNGSVFLEPDSGLITKLQGRLVKSPSFWVRDVDVTWKFMHVNGRALPIEMHSSARVRMFGRSNFKMVYDYVSIDGRPTGSGLQAERGPRQ